MEKPNKNKIKIEKYVLNFIYLNLLIIRKKTIYMRFKVSIIVTSSPAFLEKGSSLSNTNT